MPAARTSVFARDLSSVMPSATASLPVYGMPSRSSSAGTCDSRLREPLPSAMLKTTSTFATASAAGSVASASSPDDVVAV